VAVAAAERVPSPRFQLPEEGNSDGLVYQFRKEAVKVVSGAKSIRQS